MKLNTMMVFTSAIIMLSTATYAESMSNTGTPQTGAYTPGGRAPQTNSNSAPSASPDQNKGSSDWYFDQKTYTWKQKGK